MGAALQSFWGILEQSHEAGAREVRYTVPTDAFADTRSEAAVAITALQLDGRPLPSWLRFDPVKGEFRGVPPAEFKGEIAIRVIAKDDAGAKAETQFRVRIGDANDKVALKGKPSLTSQLRGTGVRNLQYDRDRFIRYARNTAQARTGRAA